MFGKSKWNVKPRALGFGVLGVLLLLIGIGIIALLLTKESVSAVRQGDLARVQILTRVTQPLVFVLDITTLGLVPDFEVWTKVVPTLRLAAELQQASDQVTQQLSGAGESRSLRDLGADLDGLHTNVSALITLLPKTWIAKNYISPDTLVLLQSANQLLPAGSALLQSLTEDPDQTWVVLLQNSDELRATGGFAGSYALLTITDGTVTETVIEDIYDADGQFTGYVDPPPGIKEYTSGIDGLRLPDANWWPDFPQSAQTIMQFFALGNRKDISGIIAVNLPVMKEVLAITGPIWLPDNKVELTADNINQLLRTERGDFFPGSQQKKNLLEHAQSMIMQKLAQASPEEKKRLFMLLMDSLENKNMQIFALQPEIQEQLVASRIGGTLGTSLFTQAPEVIDCGCQPNIFMQVESNVGINKVNPYIERASALDFAPQKVTLKTLFQNSAPSATQTSLGNTATEEAGTRLTTQNNQNGYINYHRVYVDPSYVVESISINEQLQSSWDESIIKTSDDTELKEIGFLVGVPASSSSQVVLSLTTPDGFPPQVILLPKQAGVPPYQFQISTPQGSTSHLLEKDMLIELR